MELKRPCGISDRLLNAESADGIWNACNEMLGRPEFSYRGILDQMNVVLVCTTDDPTDSLEHHLAVADDTLSGVQMLPAWRPDSGMDVKDPLAFNT